VVSGVGHEIDFTNADLVADRRAPTPSAAAELVVPDRRELRAHLARVARGLLRTMGSQLERADARFRGLLARLRPLQPGRRIEQQGQRLDELEQRLRRAWMARHGAASTRVSGAARALNAVSPLATLTRGYAIITCKGQMQPVVDVAKLDIGDRVEARFAAGNATLTVERTGVN
jgi:exodeoxyribonuclease VII large subunit